MTPIERRTFVGSENWSDCSTTSAWSCWSPAISPFRAGRDAARELAGPGRFVEVHVDTPLEVAEERDVKGLYKRARSGELLNFTGIDSPYEVPLRPEVHIDSTFRSPEDAADEVIRVLVEMGLVRPNRRAAPATLRRIQE